MAVTNYISIDGMLVGEETGGVMRNYGTDALGSIIETASNGVEENTYVYKPCGGTLAKTGTASDPNFLWNGGSGYRATTLPSSTFYVRRRHYSIASAQWTTVDPLWPSEQAYGYAKGMIVSVSDPTGLDITLTASWTSDYVGYFCRCAIPVLSCGRSSDWSISTKDTGWIVQKIINVTKRAACKGDSYTDEKVWFEAWRVVKGEVYCGSATLGRGRKGTDLWFHGAMKPRCSKADILSTGEAYFFLDPLAAEVITWDAGSGSCGNPIPVLNVNADTPDPQFWGSPSSNPQIRSMHTKFDCCGGKNCSGTPDNCCTIQGP